MSDYREDDSYLNKDDMTSTGNEEAPSGSHEAEDQKASGQSTEEPVDGTYRYSYRKGEEEYRRPPYMREEIGGSKNQSSDSWGQSEEAQSGRQERYSYSGDSSNDGGRDSYSGGHDSGSSRPPKKRGKTVAVITGALVLGGVIGVACWSIGGQIGRSSAGAAVGVTTEASGLEASAAASESQTAESQTGGQDQEETGTAGNGQASIATGSSSEGNSQIQVIDVADVVDIAMPSVVAITTTTVYESYSNYGYNPFNPYGSYGNGGSGSNQYEVQGAGSGIIIGDDGEELWIVTNNHVVEDSETLTVSFSDGTTADAYIKGTDSENDLAVVGIKLENLSDSTKQTVKAIQMGDSDSLRLGESVIAIGNALGIGQSVTTGCVSAVNREITTDENTTLTTIQTDAAINPGNSGGALLNSKGELIGINVAKDTEDNVEGMGYAIPISSAKDIIEKLTTMTPKQAVSEEEFPYMGVQLKDINSSVAQAYGMPAGILVYSVEEGTPADDAGMLVQDIITKFDGTSVSSYDELYKQLQYYAGGTTVTVTVQRLENGAYVEKELTMTLGLKSDYQTTEESTQVQGQK